MPVTVMVRLATVNVWKAVPAFQVTSPDCVALIRQVPDPWKVTTPAVSEQAVHDDGWSDRVTGRPLVEVAATA